MADERKMPDGGLAFPASLVTGLAALLMLAIVAFIVLGWGFGLVILGLIVLVGGAALFYRILAERGSEEEPQGGLPKLPADSGRPLGDTKEAHDEINPHDFPHDSVNRKPAEAMARDEGGTTGGLDEGGAAGEGGPSSGDQDSVPDEEREQGARP